METNGTPPSARRMWHDRAAHACDFAQRYAEPLDYAVSQRMIELSRQRRGLACGGGSGREAVALSDRGSTAAGFQLVSIAVGFHTRTLRRSQDSGNSVVNSVCRDSADGLCQSGCETHVRALLKP